MAYIKKMVVHGFKSFARKTEIDFDKEINLFVGPNGSGKTNVAEALTFVLGRLSVKSMRAAKARNLIFMGSKYIKPSKEALVELIFDNHDKAFSLDKTEVSLKRIVRRNGQSIYKINDETKTRTEVIEMLAQAGIDPYGFNMVMQGQIQSIVKMHAEERRKIIEDVAGISIYETRKEKSLRELEKTEERLKEINTILRERTAFLRNLEREKNQAEKFKEAELTVKRAKASILSRKLKDKEKELEGIFKTIQNKDKIKDEMRKKIEQTQNEIEEIGLKINEINKHIQKSTGLEQETLHNDVANLKAEIEGLKVRIESYENRRNEIQRRINEMSKNVPEIDLEIQELRKKSPMMAKKAEGLKKKREELAEIEQERKKILTLKSDLSSLKERIKDKEKQLVGVTTNSKSFLERIEEISIGINYNEETECLKAINKFKENLFSKNKEIENLINNELDKIKIISISDSEIGRIEKIRNQVEKIDICPLCQSMITEEHIKHVYDDCESKIAKSRNEKEKAMQEIEEFGILKENLKKEIKDLEQKISSGEKELFSHRNISEKKEQLKKAVDDEHQLKKDIQDLEEKRKRIEEKSVNVESIEERYHKKIFEIEELSARTEEDIDTTLLYKERELENTKNIIKRSKEDLEEIENQIGELSENLEKKTSKLEELDEKEKELQEKFKQMFASRDELQHGSQNKSLDVSEKQQELRQLEDQINYLKIGKAKLDAEKEALEIELTEFVGIELIQGTIPVLDDRLRRSQEILQNIGAINMRALEVYDQVKKEYDIVQQRVDTLVKEKDDIMKIIEEIDKKKTRTFMKTYKAINEIFSENFAKLSVKGHSAYLDIENKESLFEGGINIVVKLAKGKYFDVTSLSGGEQTLVALSLLFAIQEYKPYHFYIFDEIDAALDKRNSERLSALLNQYMKSGQYIVITHNDALITNSNVLYGVTMHEGVSKILSMRIDSENIQKEKEIQKKIIDAQKKEIGIEEEIADEDYSDEEDDFLDEKKEDSIVNETKKDILGGEKDINNIEETNNEDDNKDIIDDNLENKGDNMAHDNLENSEDNIKYNNKQSSDDNE